MGGAVSTGLLIAYRRRQQRRLAIASMRRRIARDLHDDIGANLTRIAVLSEVAQKLTNDSRPDGALASIARTARDSVTTMADIVWAVSPKEDDVDDLARKLREYGDETCTAAGIRFSTDFPASDQDRLDLDVRRDLYLIFKEAVTNAIRHSGSTSVRARIRRNRSAIVLEVADDGRGLPVARRPGQGLRNMEERALRHGGRFSIEPSPEAGTTVRVELPARRSHLFRQVARGWFTRLG
jgi:signal transduction histidine kinase